MMSSLTSKRIAKLSEPGRYRDPDSKGLYLQVGRTGSKSWLLRYEIASRERFMGLGSLTDFTLREARERARAARQKLADGIDPIEERLAERDAKRAEKAADTTFKQAAEQYLALHAEGWRNAKHRQQWANTLATYAFPTLGIRPVRAVDAALINEALAPIWPAIPETASRVRQRIERIVRWVKDGKPLPVPNKSQTTEHHPALHWQSIPAFMADLRRRESISARALEFLTLTVARTGAVIGARWPEIDLAQKVWTVPRARAGTKLAQRDHRVPLSDRAVGILRGLPRERGNDHVFIGGKAGAGLSNMALLELMKGMAYPSTTADKTAVPHGLRSSFRDWAAETTAYPNHVVEMALAHTISNKVEAAYRRGDLFQKRARLMAEWERYCARPTPGKVVPLAVRRAGR